ncbi:MAG: NAD(P)H-dependent oxidoreductase [Thermoguttaceae bacterium]|nr:NAD(P)H-dependent oxidoreductase [Thermoguttaceae bacterium]
MPSNQVLIVVARPEAEKSFNGAIVQAAADALTANGYAPVISDLYAENFDPTMTLAEVNEPVEKADADIQARIQAVKESVGLIFVHPNWWGGPPAILKGWLDRVLRNGFAYGFTADGPWQGLTDKTVQVFSTSNTPRDVELNVYGDPLENFWKTIVFGLCGSKSFERRNFEQIILSDEAQRAAWLAEVGEIVARRFPQVG